MIVIESTENCHLWEIRIFAVRSLCRAGGKIASIRSLGDDHVPPNSLSEFLLPVEHVDVIAFPTSDYFLSTPAWPWANRLTGRATYQPLRFGRGRLSGSSSACKAVAVAVLHFRLFLYLDLTFFNKQGLSATIRDRVVCMCKEVPPQIVYQGPIDR